VVGSVRMSAITRCARQRAKRVRSAVRDRRSVCRWSVRGAFNPAVALGASVLGIFTWSHYWLYVIATLLGGAVAAAAFLYLQPDERPREHVRGAHFTSTQGAENRATRGEDPTQAAS
jgi:hypothetical protein